MGYDLVSVGLAYTDLIVSLDEAAFIALDCPRSVGRPLERSEIPRLQNKFASTTLIKGGGATANTACGVAALGANAGFIGKVGDDIAGAEFKRQLHDANVEFLNLDTSTVSGQPSAMLYVFATPDNERTMMWNRGVAEKLKIDDFSLLEKSRVDICLIEGLIVPYITDVGAFDIYKRKVAEGSRIVLSLQAVKPALRDHRSFKDFVQIADYLVGNRDEISLFLAGENISDISQWAAAHKKTVFVTEGAAGVSVHTPAAEHVKVPAVKIDKIVDSVGAGDQFLAGVIYGLCQKWPVMKAAQLGTKCAAEILATAGARPNGSWQHLIF